MAETRVSDASSLSITKARVSDSSKTLPHELIVEILSRLPIQHLSPLRFVSKTWLQLLTADSQFAKSHFDRMLSSNSNPSILVNRRSTERSKPVNRSINERFISRRRRMMMERIPPRTVDFYLATDYDSCDKAIKLDALFDKGINGTTYSVHGICNGLVCLSHKEMHEQVFIWNPLTNVHISICNFDETYKVNASFAFGYHQGSNEYKVIKVVPHVSGTRTYVGVHTLKKYAGWRTLEECMKWKLCTNESPLVNGILHWLASKSESRNDYDGILALDLEKESFEVIQLPHDIDFPSITYSTGIKNLGGLLCVYIQSRERGLEIWALKEYGVLSSWTKQLKISAPQVDELFNNPTPLGILAVTHNEEYVIEKSGEELFLYNSKSNSAKKLTEFGFKFRNAYNFIGGIISPMVIKGACKTRQPPGEGH